MMGIQFLEKYPDRTEIRNDGKDIFVRGDAVFYHPEIDELMCFDSFLVLLPEKYGWVEIGEL